MPRVSIQFTIFAIALLCLHLLETVTCDDSSNWRLLDRRQEMSGSQIAPTPTVQRPPSPTRINTAAPLATNNAGPRAAAVVSGVSAAVNSSNPLGALPTHSTFGISVHPGRATFITPTQSRSLHPLYRIDPRENVTMVWEFKDVKVRPVNMTLAAVGPNSITHTISVMDGGQTSAVWHLSDVPPQSQLMNGFYGIKLYDQRGISAFHQPGWLSPQTQLTIAFYTTSKYQDSKETAGSSCPLCAVDDAGVRALGSLAIAFFLACITSAIFIYSLLY